MKKQVDPRERAKHSWDNWDAEEIARECVPWPCKPHRGFIDNVPVLVCFLTVAALAVSLVTWCTGCHTPACTAIGTTRCNKNIVETCGSNKHWQRVLDCSAVRGLGKPSWSCALSEEKKEHTCLPR